MADIEPQTNIKEQEVMEEQQDMEAELPEELGQDSLDLDDEAMSPDEEIGQDVNLTTDGGVKKKILVRGQGWEMPERGDIVHVHYVGTLLDGTKFDSSRDRNEPFTFNLGEGRVIKGWDIGVATMKRGEKAVLTCAAAYAYGEAGSPPKIPPNATLQFEVELLSWTSLRDLTGDGGVIKTVVRDGQGWQKPDDGDEVVVHYTASVQGAPAPFYQTPEAGITFTVSQGTGGIKALPTAIKTMKKGEHVTLVVKPEYAFGDAGREGVPPNSTLDIALSLEAIHKVERVTDDGGVIKKTLVESNEWKRPNEGAKVTVEVVGKLSDGIVFESHPESAPLVFTTDEDMVPDGLDQAIQKMKVGESAQVVITPDYGYGATPHTGNTGVAVPPGSTLTYDLKLVATENAKESWEMSDAEKVEAASARKEKANKYYKEGRTARAVRLWDKAASYISYDKTFTDELKASAKEVRRAVQLNLAAAHVKLRNWGEAVAQASKVLESEPNNVKALYRRAQALMSRGDLVEAEVDVKRGLLEAPTNTDLATLHRTLKVALKKQAEKESAMYSRMFKFPAAGKKATDATKPAGANGLAAAGGDAAPPPDVTMAQVDQAAPVVGAQ